MILFRCPSLLHHRREFLFPQDGKKIIFSTGRRERNELLVMDLFISIIFNLIVGVMQINRSESGIEQYNIFDPRLFYLLPYIQAYVHQ